MGRLLCCQILASQKLSHPLSAVEPVVSGDFVIDMQRQVREAAVEDSLVDYLLAVTTQTRSATGLDVGASPRASLFLYRAAQALALLRGRTYCVPDDVKQIAVPVLAHRLIARNQTSSDRFAFCRQVVAEILDATPVPM